MREKLGVSILSITHDSKSREAGLSESLVLLIRHALFALADEISSSPNSRCNYITQGRGLSLQQEHMHTDNAGEQFFVDLSRLLPAAREDPARAATLSVYALCLSLGFRGIYRGHGLEGYDELRTKVMNTIKPGQTLTALPELAPCRWPRSDGTGTAWPSFVVASVLMIAVGALVTLHVEIGGFVEVVTQRLSSAGEGGGK
jgi:type IV/VI secretion system ImpK/VasF family protein